VIKWEYNYIFVTGYGYNIMCNTVESTKLAGSKMLAERREIVTSTKLADRTEIA